MVKLELSPEEARAVLEALKARVRHLGLSPESTKVLGAANLLEEKVEEAERGNGGDRWPVSRN